MPPTNTDEGIRIANELLERYPAIGVVVLSQYSDPAYVLALLEHGSERRAYLLKERVHNRAELTAAIRAVAMGDSRDRLQGRRTARSRSYRGSTLAARRTDGS